MVIPVVMEQSIVNGDLVFKETKNAFADENEKGMH
jgi:hypothetical protein